MSFRVKPCESIFSTQKCFRNKPSCSHPLFPSLANLYSFESLPFCFSHLQIKTQSPVYQSSHFLQAYTSPAHSFISSTVADPSSPPLAGPSFLIVSFLPRVSSIPWVRGFCLHPFCCFPAAGELVTDLFQEWLLMTEISTE